MASPPIDLGTPNTRISPLIKLSRWSLLIAGIFWGMHRSVLNEALIGVCDEVSLVTVASQCRTFLDIQSTPERTV